MKIGFEVAFVVACSLIASRLLAGVIVYATAGTATRRNYGKTIRAKLRWHWLCRNLNLSYVDPHKRRRIRDLLVPVGRTEVVIGRKSGRIIYPKARFRPDEYGLRARVRTSPRVGRKELDLATVHLADAWRCARVSVAQDKPGRLIVRGLVRDPLQEPLSVAECPPGTFDGTEASKVYLGKDEWAQERWRTLKGLTGVTIVGQPDFGKTNLIQSMLCQLSGSEAAQFVILDGKGSGDYADWRDRVWRMSGDDLTQAVEIITEVHSLMRKRLSAVASDRSLDRNSWRQGPTSELPLIFLVVDECHTYLDLEGVKYDKHQESMVRELRTKIGQLIRQGRSSLFVTVLASQRGTVDSIPSALRESSALGLAFACRTKEGAVAALGEDIRAFPSYCPTGLRDLGPGVATSNLTSGMEPFTRIRVPYLTEEFVQARAKQTASLYRDPSVIVPRLELAS